MIKIKPVVFATIALGLAVLLAGSIYQKINSKALGGASSPTKIKVLKDVGEAYLDRFGLSDSDFKTLVDAKVNVIEGNFDICADDKDVSFLLSQSQKYGIKVIMPAGSGEAEWGYDCDQETFPTNQKPVWNREAVLAWINKWKSHPAIYAWDTSNEAGSVFPNQKPENMLSVEQLKQAYLDVKSVDQSRPVMIRQNGWFYYDYETDFFRQGNPFSKNVADIVMINAYSNVEDYFPDFVTTVATRSIAALRSLEPDTKIIVSLGVWEEKPLWVKPTADQLTRDLDQLNGLDLLGVAYFKYGASGSEWYLPDQKTGAPELLSIISKDW